MSPRHGLGIRKELIGGTERSRPICRARRQEGWPDDAWRNWRYHRATFARLLARENLMQQVADAYTIVRDTRPPRPPNWWEQR